METSIPIKTLISVDPITFPLTGIGRYTWELIQQLQLLSDIELSYFSGRRIVQQLPSPDAGSLTDTPNATSDRFRLKRLVQSNGVFLELYRLCLPLLQRQALKGYEEHIYHATNYYLPPLSGPGVATFHDLSPFTWAHYHPAQRVRFMQKSMRASLGRASALITDSEFTRREVADYFSWPLDKVFAVPLASGSEFHPRSSDACRAILNEYDLDHGGYTLYVGTIEPRKNLLTLLDAYSRLPLSMRRRWPLIFAGYYGWGSDAVHRRIDKAKAEGWAKYLGFTPSEHLPVLYSGARLFTFPSFYEGFGLPVLEAMASGVPVVCSDSASLPEVVGDCGLMTTAENVEGFTELIRRGLEDEIWRDSAILSGQIRAKKFSWQECAQNTYKVYKRVVEQI
ncbi:glycosyltransferase family 4 protein [Aestuariicella sp. G3-2]|uniref:glycosyltransferase family 4 protein n=1 Tax=Pseudomaricurvus albidus TaxID=2842452 RepID=UPI001C0E56CE|nr:glycosyltransferase family 1 protein [Aestuariicella albida]MBU3071668.1 glycosyltransferase family 4 protein [Aestuariicella albida]